MSSADDFRLMIAVVVMTQRIRNRAQIVQIGVTSLILRRLYGVLQNIDENTCLISERILKYFWTALFGGSSQYLLEVVADSEY